MASEQDAQHIRDMMDSWTAQSILLRKIDIPHPGAPVQDVHASLVEARGKLDGLEELLSNAIALRGMARRRRSAAQDKVSDAWDTEYDRRKRAGKFHSEDYKSGKEKEAEINLAIRAVRLEDRELREILDACSECTDRLWLRYNGLKGVREDLTIRLRALAFENHLDR